MPSWGDARGEGRTRAVTLGRSERTVATPNPARQLTIPPCQKEPCRDAGKCRPCDADDPPGIVPPATTGWARSIRCPSYGCVERRPLLQTELWFVAVGKLDVKMLAWTPGTHRHSDRRGYGTDGADDERDEA